MAGRCKSTKSLENKDVEQMRADEDQAPDRYQGDWAARVEHNGKVTGRLYRLSLLTKLPLPVALPTRNRSRKLEAIVTNHDGPVHVVSSAADQMFRDITPGESAGLPRYTGEMELTNHSAGSLTSQAYQKRWIRKQELLADAAEKASVMAEWLGARPYPRQRLNDAWTLTMGAHFHDVAAGTATPKSYEFAWNDDVIAMNQFAGVLSNATEGVAAAMNTSSREGTPVIVFNPLNIAREDLVLADVTIPEGKPAMVIDVNGQRVKAQITQGKVLFPVRVPPAGYAVYQVIAGGDTASDEGAIWVSNECRWRTPFTA